MRESVIRSPAALLGTALLALLLSGIAGAAADGWVTAAKARTPEDISLWTRSVPGAALKAFRGATHVTVPMESAVAFVYDISTMTRWIFRCQEARLLAEESDGSRVIHLKIKGIWPMDDRDAVIRVTPTLDTATGELRLTGIAAPDYLPKQEGYIRIPSIESSWLMKPAANGLLRVELTGHVDPAGNVPLWLANSVVTLVPRYTLKHMRELVSEPKWQTPAQRELGSRLIERTRPLNP